DPAGGMVRLDDDVLWFADRPGNRRVDSFSNIVGQPEVALALLIPGSHRIVLVNGRARLTKDQAARDLFTVKDKTPLLAVRVQIASIALHDSAALTRADLWPVRSESDIEPARLFMDRSEEHTSELQSREKLVCRLLLEKKKTLVKDYQGGVGAVVRAADATAKLVPLGQAEVVGAVDEDGGGVGEVDVRLHGERAQRQVG